MAIMGLVLVGVGVLLILLGAYMSHKEWQRKLDELPHVQAQALEDELKGLARLADALKGYPVGMQLIVWGIVIIIIGGTLGGVAGLVTTR